MSERQLNRPLGPLQEGDQAVVDALNQLPVDNKIYQIPHETVITDFVGNRETTPSFPKDHWSVAFLETDDEGMPEKVETTLVTVSAKDINVTLRDGNLPAPELRTEENKPKAIDREKLHDRKTEQAIKLLAAKRLTRAADVVLKFQGIERIR